MVGVNVVKIEIMDKLQKITRIPDHERAYLRRSESGIYKFGKKTPTNGTSFEYPYIWKELYYLILYSWITGIDGNPAIYPIDGVFAIERDNVAFDWKHKLDNPEIKVSEEEISFMNLMFCDVLTRHENRAKGKNEHVGLLPKDDTHLIFPVDNENSLENLKEEISSPWIDNFFSADHVRDKNLLIEANEKNCKVPIGTINFTAVKVILDSMNLSEQKAEEIIQYSNKKVQELNERLARVGEAILSWHDWKFGSTEESVQPHMAEVLDQ